jgi:hypothetical protein
MQLAPKRAILRAVDGNDDDSEIREEPTTEPAAEITLGPLGAVRVRSHRAADPLRAILAERGRGRRGRTSRD